MPAQHLLRSLVGESVGVEAYAIVGAEDDAAAIAVAHIVQQRDCVEVLAVVHGGHGDVVLDEEASLVGGMLLSGAVAEPEEVPVIAIWGVRGGGGAADVAGASRKVGK